MKWLHAPNESFRIRGLREGIRAWEELRHALALRRVTTRSTWWPNAAGLGSAESFRRVFHRHLGVSPDAYRRRFRTTTRGDAAVGAAVTRHEGASA
jgi:hypothetical protein